MPTQYNVTGKKWTEGTSVETMLAALHVRDTLLGDSLTIGYSDSYKREIERTVVNQNAHAFLRRDQSEMAALGPLSLRIRELMEGKGLSFVRNDLYNSPSSDGKRRLTRIVFQGEASKDITTITVTVEAKIEGPAKATAVNVYMGANVESKPKAPAVIAL